MGYRGGEGRGGGGGRRGGRGGHEGVSVSHKYGLQDYKTADWDIITSALESCKQ